MVYHETKFSLTTSQLQKIASAVHSHTEFTLRLNKSDMNQNGYNLPLTQTQLKKLNDGKDHDLKFSSVQTNHIKNKVKSGGFLPLAALIPVIASVLGGLGSVAGTIASSVQKRQANREIERHNKEIENQLKNGTGFDKLIKHYNKMAGKGHCKDDIIKSLHSKFGSGPVTDFISKIPLLGHLLYKKL